MSLDAHKLKWIAIVGMITNHGVFALREVIPFALQFPLYALGGLTFPIMAFFVVEGYKHTKSLGRYIGRLAIFGLLAQIPYMLALRLMQLNIMFTIILGLLLLLAYDKIKSRVLFGLVFVVVLLVSLVFDWAVVGVLTIFLYRAIKNEGRRRTLPGIVAGLFMLGNSLMLILTYDNPAMRAQLANMGMDFNFVLVGTSFIVGCFAAAFLVRGYNGERGKRIKWAFYLAYPLHLAVLAAIALALGLVSLESMLPI